MAFLMSSMLAIEAASHLRHQGENAREKRLLG